MIDNPKTEKTSFENVKFQTSSVPCKDTENYGSGSNRDRVCAHGTTAFCDWENWSAPGTNGTCTLSGGGPGGPEEPM